tara:strand:+ start:346 stop:1872 length:1527 start_codon:yes stop_codon:yes gene_type:complete
MKNIIGIACLDNNMGIGCNSNLLYYIKEDMRHFRKTTCSIDHGMLECVKKKQNVVIMGRITFESLPQKLSNRINYVITSASKISDDENLLFFSSLESAIQCAQDNLQVENIYIIGGYSIYNECVTKDYFTHLILSRIDKTSDSVDIYFPNFNANKYVITDIKRFPNINYCDYNKSTGVSDYQILYFERRDYIPKKLTHRSFLEVINTPLKSNANYTHPETQYLDILNSIINTGNKRQSRNSITLSKFGVKMEFDVSESVPILTTKRVYFKGIVKELLWFLNGNTNALDLNKEGVGIWDGNSTREFLDSRGLNHYEVGDCGPIYGFQWRHYNAEYKGVGKDYKGLGVDQLKYVINEIKENPTSRRIFLTSWNPCQLNEMTLPPCHVSYQFYVRTEKDKTYLDCMMYQRSGDLFLGVPFNIGSTSIFCYIVANICNISPGKITIVIGDAHIYDSHIEQVKIQLTRSPFTFPKLKINKKLHTLRDLENLNYEDFELINYNHYPSLKAKMIP